MKKNISLLLLLILLVSCSKKTPPVTPKPPENKTATGAQVQQNATGVVNPKTATGAKTTVDTSKVDQVIAKVWDNVEVNYTGKLADGTVFDSSYPRNKTLPFTIGAGQMIPGFDKAVVGMKVWEKKTVTLPPSEAYGDYDPKNVVDVKRSQFKELEAKGFKLIKGHEVPTQFWPLMIKNVSWDVVTVDVNHKLAWKTLTFEIEMMKISPPLDQVPLPIGR